MQPICFTAPATDEVAVDSLFELSFGNGKENLGKWRGRLRIVQIQHPEWIQVERLNLGATFFKKPADDPEVA